MIVEIARALVLLLGGVVCALSVWGLFSPRRLLALVRQAVGRKSGVAFAVLLRLVLGVALIVSAGASRFPGAFLVLGVITLLAAVALPILGRDRLGALVGWFERTPPSAARAWLVLGIALGAFLIYGVW